jgi:hypothetical protein
VRAAKNKPQGVGFNASMLLLLDSGFVAKQATGIRRLVDRSDDVVSLKRIVKHIKEKRELITREVFVAHDGLPYDYAPVRDAYFAEKVKEGESFSFDGVETTGTKAWGASKRVHEVFDKLSGVSSDQRTRDDLIPAQWFDDLGSKLGVCGEVQKFTDKFIAHAADANSRSDSTDDQKTITLNKLAKCLRAIVVAANEVSRSILGDGSSWAVPQPQFDPVENFDKGWVAEGALEEAHGLWEKHMAAIAQWSD